MMGRTDQHYRWLVRQFCPDILLFTEMITCNTLLHAPEPLRQRLTAHDKGETPVAIQLAGCHPDEFAACTPFVAQQGFAEININAGCPSKRATSGQFGATLMRNPQLVAELVRAVRQNCQLPVTVKTRLGVDEMDSDDHLADFLQTVSATGCSTFYLHARKALLLGPSPAANRSVPPLDYARVARMQAAFPHLQLIVNGGISEWSQAEEMMSRFTGIMVGRAAYLDLPLLLRANQALTGRVEGADAMAKLPAQVRTRLANRGSDKRGASLLLRHLCLLFRRLPQASKTRQQLSQWMANPADAERGIQHLPWHQIPLNTLN